MSPGGSEPKPDKQIAIASRSIGATPSLPAAASTPRFLSTLQTASNRTAGIRFGCYLVRANESQVRVLKYPCFEKRRRHDEKRTVKQRRAEWRRFSKGTTSKRLECAATTLSCEQASTVGLGE